MVVCLVTVRVTFSLTGQTVAEIRRAAARLGKPQSHVVRDAVADYAARLYRSVRRPRGRAIDLAVAACALTAGAALWTLNPGDFADVPALRLVRL